MYCFDKEEYFCAKCDFKSHNQKHVKCEGDTNKGVSELKELAVKEANSFHCEMPKLKYRLKHLIDYKEYVKLHIVETFIRMAIFHFQKLDFLKGQCSKM